MQTAKTQIQDIRKQISDLKESRKAVSSANKKFQIQIDENRKKRAHQSAEIKKLFTQIHDVRKTYKAQVIAERKAKVSTKKTATKKEPVTA